MHCKSSGWGEFGRKNRMVSAPSLSDQLALATWGALLALVYFALKRNAKTATLLGACVVSHWFLDWVVHLPDLPLTPRGDARYGLGLWNPLVKCSASRVPVQSQRPDSAVAVCRNR